MVYFCLATFYLAKENGKLSTAEKLVMKSAYESSPKKPLGVGVKNLVG